MPKRQPHTGERKLNKQRRVQQYVHAQAWQRIGGAEWEQLRSALPDVSSTTMRTALAQMLSFDQPFAGVDTKSLSALETSLLEMGAAYQNDAALGFLCRNEVITAKGPGAFRFTERESRPGEARAQRRNGAVDAGLALATPDYLLPG